MPVQLPPLDSVRAFEAAARLLDFERAAEELNVTSDVVAGEIARLETHTGAPLFERLPEGLRLTPAGGALRDAISPSFRGLERAFRIFRSRPEKAAICRLATLTSFASQFLAPRFSLLEELHPDIQLEISTDERLVDLTREDYDLCVRFGVGGAEGLIETPLVPGVLTPVASPRLARRLREKSHGLQEALSDVGRIQVFANSEWRTWAKAERLDLTRARPARFIEDFVVAIEAVRTGDYIALIPEIIVREHLANHVLVRFSNSIPWTHTYYTAHLPGVENKPGVREIIAWLRAETAAPV